METKPIFYQMGQGLAAHTIVVGITGKGKSVILEEEAKRLGITYDELLKRMEPTEEQKATMEANKQKRAEEQRAKDSTIRNAIWATFDQSDIDEFLDALKVILEINEPTKSNVKEVFFALDMSIVGNIVSWGVGDTPTREAIWEFVRENKTLLLDSLLSEQSETPC